MVSKISGFVRSGLAGEPKSRVCTFSIQRTRLSRSLEQAIPQKHTSRKLSKGLMLSVTWHSGCCCCCCCCFEKGRNLGYKRYTHRTVSPLMRSEVYLVLVVAYQVFVFKLFPSHFDFQQPPNPMFSSYP